MKKTAKSFTSYFGDFLNIYLPRQRNCSKHTILAAKQTWCMLLSFICRKTGKKVEKVSFDDLTRSAIVDFLDTSEGERGWAPATRNHRLSLIRSFFYYASGIERTLVVYSEPLRSIPRKKGVNKSHILDFMQPGAMSAILRQPDTSTDKGVRDTFFMVLMFDTAARDCEMLSMLHSAIDTASKTAYLLGKGNKPRVVPIGADTVQHFLRYSSLFHPSGDGSQPMFYTVRNGVKASMSDDNVAKFLQKYADGARLICSDVPPKVTPHTVRRTRAMQLYRQGMPLATLAQWLGHEDPETTLVYARADTEMKRIAIEKAEAEGASVIHPVEEIEAVWEDNEDMIKRLCGLA
jgi:site-specific recombinase XerD